MLDRFIGSIPAWAGETSNCCPIVYLIAVYPRVGGGNEQRDALVGHILGLSPRGRGKRAAGCYGGARIGSIPAWAGETCLNRSCRRWTGVYPRVGGGNRCRIKRRKTLNGLSPRGRGKHRKGDIMRFAWRSIPAWAGETSDLCYSYTARAVYPRVGGGNVRPLLRCENICGLSPRGRGKPPCTLPP